MWQYTVTRGTVTLSDAAATRLDPAATEELFAVHTAWPGRRRRASRRRCSMPGTEWEFR